MCCSGENHNTSNIEFNDRKESLALKTKYERIKYSKNNSNGSEVRGLTKK
jgi:hypothetical protein